MAVQDKFESVFEDVYDALRALLQALGGAKVVASKLWPHKAVAEAQRELLDALNRDRPRKLDPEELMLLFQWGREAGFHAAKHFIDVKTGYDRTPPSDPKVEEDKLVIAISDATRALAQGLKQLEVLQSRKPPLSVAK